VLQWDETTLEHLVILLINVAFAVTQQIRHRHHCQRLERDFTDRIADLELRVEGNGSESV